MSGTKINEIKMEQSAKVVNIQEDKVPINCCDGVELCNLIESDSKEMDESEYPDDDQRRKLNNEHNLTKSDDDGKNDNQYWVRSDPLPNKLVLGDSDTKLSVAIYAD